MTGVVARGVRAAGPALWHRVAAQRRIPDQGAASLDRAAVTGLPDVRKPVKLIVTEHVILAEQPGRIPSIQQQTGPVDLRCRQRDLVGPDAGTVWPATGPEGGS